MVVLRYSQTLLKNLFACVVLSLYAALSLCMMFVVSTTTKQPVTKKEFGTIFGPAFMHAIGHIAANISFAAVAISLTHTVKTLEPAFNVVLSRCGVGDGVCAMLCLDKAVMLLCHSFQSSSNSAPPTLLMHATQSTHATSQPYYCLPNPASCNLYPPPPPP